MSDKYLKPQISLCRLSNGYSVKVHVPEDDDTVVVFDDENKEKCLKYVSEWMEKSKTIPKDKLLADPPCTVHTIGSPPPAVAALLAGILGRPPGGGDEKKPEPEKPGATWIKGAMTQMGLSEEEATKLWKKQHRELKEMINDPSEAWKNGSED